MLTESHTVDRLIDSGELEPTVLVTLNWYDLGFTLEEYQTNATLQAEYLDVGTWEILKCSTFAFGVF